MKWTIEKDINGQFVIRKWISEFFIENNIVIKDKEDLKCVRDVIDYVLKDVDNKCETCENCDCFAEGYCTFLDLTVDGCDSCNCFKTENK